MKQRKRIYYNAQQRALIWDRYKQGDSVHDIARLFDRFHSSILGIIHKTGGYRPPERTRSSSILSLAEREEISRGLVSNLSFRAIARKLGRAPSTISREVRRHGGLKQYRANKADAAAWENAKRPKPCKLSGSKALCSIIARKMKAAWSPQQISGWLKRKYPPRPVTNNLIVSITQGFELLTQTNELNKLIEKLRSDSSPFYALENKYRYFPLTLLIKSLHTEWPIHSSTRAFKLSKENRKESSPLSGTYLVTVADAIETLGISKDQMVKFVPEVSSKRILRNKFCINIMPIIQGMPSNNQ